MITWEAFIAIFPNPFILSVAGLQFVGGMYSFHLGDWRLGVVNTAVSIANVALSTMKG